MEASVLRNLHRYAVVCFRCRLVVPQFVLFIFSSTMFYTGL